MTWTARASGKPGRRAAAVDDEAASRSRFAGCPGVSATCGLLALGRLIEFFVRSGSDALALALETAQWTSIALIAVAAADGLGRQRTLAIDAAPAVAWHRSAAAIGLSGAPGADASAWPERRFTGRASAAARRVQSRWG